MTTPAKITGWLQQPERISEQSFEECEALIKAFPYFAPAHHITLVNHHRQEPFSAKVIEGIQPYLGNWLQFHEWLKSASGPQQENHISKEIPEKTSPETDDSEPVFFKEEELFEEDFFEEIPEEEESVAFLSENQEEAQKEEKDSGTRPEEGREPEAEPEEVSKREASEMKTESAGSQSAGLNETAPEPPAENLQEETESRKESFRELFGDKPIEEIPFFQNRKEDSLIQPLFTEDYFLHQGLHVSDKIPEDIDVPKKPEEKSLMVVMSFAEWLMHFKTKKEREKEEQQEQKALKMMWQREKLAAALEEEDGEIPETVFEMAVNSISKEEGLISEPLAEILLKQGKYEQAIEMYHKLSLRNPQKNTYFAQKIEEIRKLKDL